MIEDTPGHAQDKTEPNNLFREENQALCVNKFLLTRKHDDHHDRFAVLNGQWDLVRACELKGNGVRHVLQSSAVYFKWQNNSLPILIFTLFPDKGHNSRFSSNWNFFPLKNSRKRIMPENDHFITCELKQLRNALRKDVPRLKRRKWFFTCCWALHLSHDSTCNIWSLCQSVAASICAIVLGSLL